jgi:hypothetical protein
MRTPTAIVDVQYPKSAFLRATTTYRNTQKGVLAPFPPHGCYGGCQRVFVGSALVINAVCGHVARWRLGEVAAGLKHPGDST